MGAIEIANQRGWRNLLIETDSSLVVMAFKSIALVPCSLRNIWINCNIMLNNTNFIVTHIYREDNLCVDKLASIGLDIHNFTI